MASKYYLGWDVGGWNTTRKDAIVIIDKASKIIGTPFLGNLRDIIHSASTSSEFIEAIFKKSKCKNIEPDSQFIMAIDTPLGYSTSFTKLITQGIINNDIVNHSDNPYLFRETERLLFKKKFKPLSAVKDMIGSQSTKGMHVVAKFAKNVKSCGVWTDDKEILTIIEAYPTVANVAAIKDSRLNSNDLIDAGICAKIAQTFDLKRNELVQPPENIIKSEGWIWYKKSKK